jgi:hypothetical protein
VLGDRITIIAGLGLELSGPQDDRAAVRANLHRMVREADAGDHLVLNVAAYPNRTMEETEFVVSCLREAGGQPCP